MPCKVLLMIASRDESTMAARCARASSEALRRTRHETRNRTDRRSRGVPDRRRTIVDRPFESRGGKSGRCGWPA